MVNVQDSPTKPEFSLRDIAVEFLQMVAAGQVRDAYERYVSNDFIHHNPHFRGDRNSLLVAMEENAKHNPNKCLEVLRTLQDGDLVAVHSKVQLKPGSPGVALVHIFKFNGKQIVELWDIGQPQPVESLNEFGMF